MDAPNHRSKLAGASFYLAFASAVAILLSITASQILLGLSLAALLVSGEKPRLPRIWLPLALFLAGTLLSLALSPEPAHGLPQVMKMFVFSTLVVVYSSFREPASARRLFLAWGAVGTAVACFGIAQFAARWFEARARNLDFYEFYVLNRVTGVMSHWMTFAGQEMVVLLMLLAYVLFGPRGSRQRHWLWLGCAGAIGTALLLNGTRTVWLGIAVAGVWLLWAWKRWTALAAPAAIVLAMWLVPGPVHDRFVSIFRPRKDIDSNTFRAIAFRTGVRMIGSRPLTGIGLEETKYRFLDYIPEDVPRPLPPAYYQHLHNVYLQYAAERGIPTLLMLLWMLGLILYDFRRGLGRLPPGRSDRRFLLHGGIATTLGIMVSGLFEVNLGDSEVLTVFLVVVACGYVALVEYNLPGSHDAGPQFRNSGAARPAR